ncbi:hypothetical protein ACWELV_46620 [Streptomyces mirabilis]
MRPITAPAPGRVDALNTYADGPWRGGSVAPMAANIHPDELERRFGRTKS